MKNLVVMLRSWEPVAHSGTFSDTRKKGLGGTEFQLLLQSRELVRLGFRVVVLGLARHTVEENGVWFWGCNNAIETFQWLQQNSDDVLSIFFNSSIAVEKIREAAPKASLVQVCQNGPFFEYDAYIDIYGMASPGQMAFYSVNEPRYRNKYMNLPNATPWAEVFEQVDGVPKKHQIIWVGAYEKQGLRRWGKAMSKVLREDETLRWKLFAPAYSRLGPSGVPEALLGLPLPWDRVDFGNLPLEALAREMAASKMLLASLGGEDGGITYLDGHAAGVPVLSGDDIMAKYWNPEGTGIRCTTWQECLQGIRYLLANEDMAVSMGQQGRLWVKDAFAEAHQKTCLAELMGYIQFQKRKPLPAKHTVQSDRKFSLRHRLERLEIKWAKASAWLSR